MPDDAGELWTLQQAAYLVEGRRHATFDIPPLTETLAEVRASLADGLVLVARARGGWSARCAGRPATDGDWYVGRLMVAPDLQGEGLGSALLERVEALAPAGTRRVRAGHRACSASANVRFYRRRGYRVLGRRSHPGVDVLDLAKVLPAR